MHGCLGKAIKKGLPEEYVQLHEKALSASVKKYQEKFSQERLPHFTYPYMRKDIEDIENELYRIKDDFKNIVVLGTGGSSLGGQALHEIRSSLSPKIYFADNIDPHSFDQLIYSLNLEETYFLVVSKSGSTAETIIQFLCVVRRYMEATSEASISHHFMIITENKSSPLKRLADRWNIITIDHDQQLGGRYSVFSCVGMIPAFLSGLDVYAIREGAASVVEKFKYLTPETLSTFMPIQGAVANFMFNSVHKKNINVLFPYCDRLKFFASWYNQLWAESLGKNGNGSTPTQAIGATDQHSQLQLYLDGPKDKFFTVLSTDHQNKGFNCLSSEIIKDQDLDYLAEKTIGDLMQAEQQATIDTLIKNDCPTRIIHIPEINEHSIGALMMHFIFETLLTADLLNINPFDQPAVEQGKILAKKYLEQSKGA
jgi:glucose-6-phosphate isomerase